MKPRRCQRINQHHKNQDIRKQGCPGSEHLHVVDHQIHILLNPMNMNLHSTTTCYAHVPTHHPQQLVSNMSLQQLHSKHVKTNQIMSSTLTIASLNISISHVDRTKISGSNDYKMIWDALPKVWATESKKQTQFSSSLNPSSHMDTKLPMVT